MSIAFMVLVLTGMVAARPQFGGGPPPPGMGGMGPVPPPIAAVLPKEILAQLEAVHNNPALSELEKHQQIDHIMVNLPDEIHDKIPPPPGFQQLPADVQSSLKRLHRDKSLSFEQRHEEIKKILDGLSPEHRRLLPPPPPGSFPHRSPRQFPRL